MAKPRNTYILVWCPEGRPIAEVEATDPKAAKKQIPAPYNKFPGEVAVELKGAEFWRPLQGCLSRENAILLGEI